MRRAFAIGAIVWVAGCATTPLAPDPQVDLEGDWKIVAVNGAAPTLRTESFDFRYTPPSGSAQFGCNRGSGAASVRNGWLVTGDWIITAADCPPMDSMRFERIGFEILGRPLAIERAGPGTVRLRNERGSISLQRQSVPQLAGTRWRILSISGIPAPRPEMATIQFSPSSYQANFGCNRFHGEYWQEGDRFRATGGSSTEMGCESVPPAPVPLMTYEEWGARVLRAGDSRIGAAGDGRLLLENARGTMLLERLP